MADRHANRETRLPFFAAAKITGIFKAHVRRATSACGIDEVDLDPARL